MLTLRQDWLSLTSGAVATSLVAQVRTRRLRNEVTCHLIGASLDLLVSTWPRRGQPPLVLETVSRSIWKISALYYIYLWTNDDNTLSACIKLSRSETVTVILPRPHERLKQRILTAVLRGRTPCIWSFDSFISYRTIFATADQGWPRGRDILELFNAYNKRVNGEGGSDAILVQVPQELT